MTALVVISPATTTRPVVTNVSHATRAFGSTLNAASSTASEIWSEILSGWPSVTDSEVKRKPDSLLKTTPFVCIQSRISRRKRPGTLAVSVLECQGAPHALGCHICDATAKELENV